MNSSFLTAPVKMVILAMETFNKYYRFISKKSDVLQDGFVPVLRIRNYGR